MRKKPAHDIWLTLMEKLASGSQLSLILTGMVMALLLALAIVVKLQ